MTTNLENGGTYTNVFTANSKDQVLTENGDGTITVFASGGSRLYDTDLVLPINRMFTAWVRVACSS